MIKKVNKNKFGVIEYSITNEEDLKDLPKGDSDNSVYAVDDDNKVYLYSKKANNYILINGGGATNSNGLSIKPIYMDDIGTEVNLELFDEIGYYTVRGSMKGYGLHNTIVGLEKDGDGELHFALYEYSKYLHGYEDDGGIHYYEDENLFEGLQTIQNMIGYMDESDLPPELQDKSLVEIIATLYNNTSNPT